MKRKESQREETRSRPGRPMAEKIPDTPENIMRAILGPPQEAGRVGFYAGCSGARAGGDCRVKPESCYLSL